MDNESLYSIVVPIFNSGKYLNECIQSIQSQTYSNIEIILVDDGSTDSSREICESFVKNDNRFKYFFKENGGVSSARNIGIRNSSGKYISFIDSDDFVDNRYIEIMVGLIDSNIDMIVFGHKRYYGDKHDSKILRQNFINKVYLAEELKRIVIDEGRLRGFTIPSVCGVCFKSEIIKKNGIYFNESVKFNEDGLFTCEYVFQCVNDILIDFSRANYYYRLNCESSTQLNVEFDSNYKKSMDNIVAQLSKYVNENNNIYLQIQYRFASKNLSKIMSMIKNNIEYFEVRKCMTSENFLRILSVLKIRELDISLMIVYLLLKLRLYKVLYWIILTRCKLRTREK